ncbi:MAG: acyltransferase, partial [Sphingobacteriales bacterium]
MKRIPAIDGFRAIAILMVIAFHYINNQLVGTTTGIGRVLYQLTGFGWVGVDLFFVLSGFLIGSILLINRTSPKLFKTFYIRRLLRIVPNYYFLLVIFLLVKSLSYFKDDYFLTGNDVIP